MIQLFNTVLVQPLFNLLVFLYSTIPGNDLGVAIIVLTILIKVVLLPLSYQSIRSQKALQELQPKLEDLKKRFGNDKEKLARETMALYKAEKVNPLSSCLPLLIQLPFLIAVYHVFQSGLHVESLSQLYSFVPHPTSLNPISFGVLDLSQRNIILAALTGAAQFWQARMMITSRPPKAMSGSKDEDMMAMMNKQMMYMMPILTIVIGASLPSGLVLYWLVTTVLTIAQQQFMFRSVKPVTPAVIDIKE